MAAEINLKTPGSDDWKTDVSDVDRQKHGFGYQPVVDATQLAPLKVRHHDSADLMVVADIVGTRCIVSVPSDAYERPCRSLIA
jgi:hypothetical protein